MSNAKVSPGILGTWVTVGDNVYFFVEDELPTVATKREWKRRGYRVADGARNTKSVTMWNGMHYNRFTLYHITDCVWVSGIKARWRRIGYYTARLAIVAARLASR